MRVGSGGRVGRERGGGLHSPLTFSRPLVTFDSERQTTTKTAQKCALSPSLLPCINGTQGLQQKTRPRRNK